LAIAALVLLAGCQRDNQGVPAANSVAQEQPAPARQLWEALYLQGAKIGHGHTTIRPVTRDGRRLVEIGTKSHLVITRFGERTEQDVLAETLETPEGEVVEFKTEVAFGPSPTIVTGRALGDEMEITVDTQGRHDTSRIRWSSKTGGFRAIEQSLEARPMKPGEKRSLQMLMPLLNQVADVELEARDFENTPLLGIEARLLRIDGVTRFPGGNIQSTQWTDDRGEVVKTRIASLGQESFRTTCELALAPGGTEKAFDLGFDAVVKVDPPLKRPHQTRKVRYRVELADGNPAETFASGPTQSVRPLGDHAAEVTVRSVRPGDVQKRSEAAAVGREYTSANSILQIDDPRVQAMAREAKADAKDPVAVALALEGYVNRVVSEKNFSQGFATAAEVAQSREGDCTEHAVLLAALLRARGIPSRVAIGLVYVGHAGGFGYHMWTEAYLNGQWVPLDAMMGQGGTSAAYLKLTDSSLDGPSAYSSFLAVAGVLGQLKVSVLEAE
jgi:Transglutaminase-like superfamily